MDDMQNQVCMNFVSPMLRALSMCSSRSPMLQKTQIFNCKNNARNGNGTPNGCRCGEGDKNIRGACTDVPDRRRSKCPCYTSDSVLRKDVNARAARTRLAKERRAGKVQNKKGPPNVRPVLRH